MISVTNHDRCVSWLEGGVNGEREAWQRRRENNFRKLSLCLFPLSHYGAAYAQCHQKMELRSSQCSRGSSAECVRVCVIMNIDIFKGFLKDR